MEKVRRLAAAHQLYSARQHCIYGGKIKISNLEFIYTCAEILLFFFIKPNVFIYLIMFSYIILKIQ